VLDLLTNLGMTLQEKGYSFRQILSFLDINQTGFLSKMEFTNALKELEISNLINLSFLNCLSFN